MAHSDQTGPVRRRLGELKARPARLPADALEMGRQLEQSLDVINKLLDSAGRGQAINELRETLRRRAQQK